MMILYHVAQGFIYFFLTSCWLLVFSFPGILQVGTNYSFKYLEGGYMKLRGGFCLFVFF